MGRKKKKNINARMDDESAVSSETVRASMAVLLIAASVFFVLAAFNLAGAVGQSVYEFLHRLFGVGYILFPIKRECRKSKLAAPYCFFCLLWELSISLPTTAGHLANC